VGVIAVSHSSKGAVIEQLPDPFGGRDIPVMPALRADVEHRLRFLAEDRIAAAIALQPQALGHAALGPRRRSRGPRVISLGLRSITLCDGCRASALHPIRSPSIIEAPSPPGRRHEKILACGPGRMLRQPAALRLR
jgi:hypothetical protein